MEEESKHNCGQCEFYLHKPSKCPHQEKTAFDKGCENFKYTNPELRIDGLKKRIKELEVEKTAMKKQIGDLRATAVRKGLMKGGCFTGKT